MPQIDFAKVETSEKYPPLPKGKYHCTIAEVEESRTRHGDDMWRLRFEVIEGEHVGRLIFDNLVFKDKGHERVKCLCEALGLDVSGEVNLTPDAILSRSCVVDVYVSQFTDRDGKRRSGNDVAFDGFSPVRPVGDVSATPQEEIDDLPF